MNTFASLKTTYRCIFSIFIALQLFCQPAFAGWDVADLEDEFDASAISALQNQNYINLKNQVLKALDGSWCSKEKGIMLMDLTALVKPTLCVEIGAWTGSSVLPVAATLKYNNKGQIYAVDAWSNAEAVKYLETDDPNYPWWSTVNMDNVQNLCKQMIKQWALDKYCIAIQQPSASIAGKFNNIDILNIDGNFTEKGTLEDVANYLPRVRAGGYIILSNFFIMLKGKQAKAKAFSKLLEQCELVADVDNSNTIVFRKSE